MQNLFISIVSEELDKKLRGLGYREQPTNQIGQIGTGVSSDGYYYKSFGIPSYSDLVDCGTDESLFFSLIERRYD